MKAILFDLDGTLVPMDNDEFTKVYFGLLVKKMVPLGYKADDLVASVWKGTKAMVKNDGSMKNEDAFWNVFFDIYGPKGHEDVKTFNSFYENEFGQAVMATKPNPLAIEAVNAARTKADYVVVATNPFFPETAILKRLGWIGLEKSMFDYITTYENSSYCKPNPDYYRYVVKKIGVSPEDCLMIGNDINEDILAAGSIGMNTYLVKDCVIGDPLQAKVSGSFSEMIEYIRGL